jgi:hypothetical protein
MLGWRMSPQPYDQATANLPSPKVPATGRTNVSAHPWGAFLVIAFVVWQISRTFIKEPSPAATKTCPFCKESNVVDATKCRACASTI